MGYYGKLELKRTAQKLRSKGYSYKEIQSQINVSKDSLSRWCRDIVLSPEQLERLKLKKILGGDKGRISNAKKQQQLRIRATEMLFHKGIKSVGKLSNRDKFVIGLGLYIGDGNKSDKAFGFSNSDPKVVKFMVNWLKDFFQVTPQQMSGQIWIHDNLDEEDARKFWSEVTNIPIERFHKSYIAKNKSDSKKIRKKLHNYGIFRIHKSSVNIQRKILGQMAGVLGY